MKYRKLKILNISEVTKDLELPVSDTNFLFQNNKLITYTVDYGEVKQNQEDDASRELEEFLKEQEKKKRESIYDFEQKFQLRAGVWFFDQQEGLKEIPESKEKFYETETSVKLKKMFINFFEKSNLVSDKFNKKKRAYLLHSEPGMGKSAMIRHFYRGILKQEGVCVLQVNGDVDFQQLINIFLANYKEDVKKIVLVIEDFGKRDYGNNMSIWNPSCLNFLDGMQGLFRVPTLIICTTNFLEHLGAQLTNRPGRFNKIIKVLPPNDEEVFDLVKAINGIELTDSQKEAFRGKQMTPDHVIEAILRHEIEEIPIDEAAYEVMKEREGLR
jgi:SpoVK/Ycf46/Vps4 family AAA+-type ATPase